VDVHLDERQGDLPQRRSIVASCIAAGRPLTNASMQGPAANPSWLSFQVTRRTRDLRDSNIRR
jgi:hypothetical protein